MCADVEGPEGPEGPRGSERLFETKHKHVQHLHNTYLLVIDKEVGRLFTENRDCIHNIQLLDLRGTKLRTICA